MVFVVASIIYAVTVLFCVGITAWIVRARTRRRYWHKSPSDLHYIAAGAALLVGAGIGILIASQIVMALVLYPSFSTEHLVSSLRSLAGEDQNPDRATSADTAAMLFWALLASGQINMRKVDGWQTLATNPIDRQIDLAA